MNVQNGLERVSVVWWGFWGALAAITLGIGIFSDGNDRGVVTAFGGGGLVVAYVAHRLTCWIIAGFFAPRS